MDLPRIVMTAMILFSDGTPAEIVEEHDEVSVAACAESVRLLLQAEAPIREHPIRLWAVSCSVIPRQEAPR